jgi:hypothetical protein
MTDTNEALLSKINAAVAKHNAAEQAVTTAQSELVSKSKVVGQLLLEAKKRHPKVADFEAFEGLRPTAPCRRAHHRRRTAQRPA